MEQEAILIYVSTSSEDEANLIARELIEKELCACVNIIPNVKSIYKYKGIINNETEFILLIKSVSNLFPEVEKAVTSLHSYEIPEIISTKVNQGYEKYMNWVFRTVKQEKK